MYVGHNQCTSTLFAFENVTAECHEEHAMKRISCALFMPCRNELTTNVLRTYIGTMGTLPPFASHS